MMESGGDYQITSGLDFLGAYQFGEAALNDLGYVRYDGNPYDNNYGGGWTGKHGIRSANDFLNSPRVQDNAAREWVELMWHYIELQNLDDYAWTKVGGVTITPSGMLAATHLLGPDSLASYLHSGGWDNMGDPYGTRIETYIVKLSGFNIPFAPAKPQSFGGTAGQ